MTASELSEARAAPVPAPSRRVPGDLLLHPAALVAMAVVICNDRILKVHVPGPLTGKLSDFAGLVYFPLFVVAAAEVVRWATRRRPWQLDPRWMVAAVLVTGLAMVLMKTSDAAAELYRDHLGVLLWPAYAPVELVAGEGLPEVRTVGLVKDPTDLVALPALLVPLWVARSVRRSPSL